MNRWKKAVSGALTLAMLTGGAAACGASGSDVSEATTEAAAAGSDASAEGSFTGEGESSAASSKKEMIYVKADASGSAEEVTDEVTLTNKQDGNIADYSTLTDIKNTDGGEEFVDTGDGNLVWENDGEDISYEGKSDRVLPVDVKITYSLDGNEISPDDLAGQSGHVTIRFDYENKEKQTVTVDGEEIDTVVPFAAVSAIILDSDKFSNVEVTNGELVEMEGTQMAVGMAMPGLSDALQLDELDFDELRDLEEDDKDSKDSDSGDDDSSSDIDIPEYFEMEADVTDFSLDFTATILTPGLLSDMDDSDFDDLNDALDALGELGDASDEILDGFDELGDGVSEFADYFGQYTDGVSQLNTGAASLKDAMSQILAQKSQLESGAAAVADGLKQLKEGLAGVDLSSAGDTSGIAVISQALAAVGTDAQNLCTVAGQISAAVESLQNYAADVAEYEKNVKAAAEAAGGQLASIDASKLSEAEQQALAAAKEQVAGISGLAAPTFPEISVDSDLLSSSVSDMTAQMQTIQSGAAALSEALSGLSDLPDTLENLKSGVSALADGAAQLSEGVQAYDAAFQTLYDQGIVSLTDGTGQLSSAGSELSKAVSELADAVKEFRDGYREFDEEGIQKLASLGDGDIEELEKRVKALHAADDSYDNFGGKLEGQESSVTFLIETAEISAE